MSPSAEKNYPSDWSSRRQKVYRRDNYTCQNCGAKGGPKGTAELHAHHGVPLKDGATHKLGNLTTYCRRCHDAIHYDNMTAPTFAKNSTGSKAYFPFRSIFSEISGQDTQPVAKIWDNSESRPEKFVNISSLLIIVLVFSGCIAIFVAPFLTIFLNDFTYSWGVATVLLIAIFLANLRKEF